MTIRESRSRLRAAEQAYNAANPGRDLTVAREELTEARRVYSEACVRLVESLPVMLEPIALEAAQWHESVSANDEIYAIRDADDYMACPNAHMVIGDLRAIANLHKEISDEA